MKLEREDIEDFKTIYRKEYGEELSDAQAERRARQLLGFYEVILKILLEERGLGKPSDRSPARVDSSDEKARLNNDGPNTDRDPPSRGEASRPRDPPAALGGDASPSISL